MFLVSFMVDGRDEWLNEGLSLLRMQVPGEFYGGCSWRCNAWMSSLRHPPHHSATPALSADADYLQAGPTEQSATASAADGGRGTG